MTDFSPEQTLRREVMEPEEFRAAMSLLLEMVGIRKTLH
jgi:hypothetical protein